MPRTGQKVTVGGDGWVVGGGVESKFSVQLRPKLNNFTFLEDTVELLWGMGCGGVGCCGGSYSCQYQLELRLWFRWGLDNM